MKSLINFLKLKTALKTKCRTWENFIVSKNLLYFSSFLQKNSKVDLCWFLAAIFVPLKGTPTWYLHTKPNKFG